MTNDVLNILIFHKKSTYFYIWKSKNHKLGPLDKNLLAVISRHVNQIGCGGWWLIGNWNWKLEYISDPVPTINN